MKRAFLTNLGITDSEVMKQIIDYHQGIVQDLKEDLKTAGDNLKTAQGDLKTANATIVTLQDTDPKADAGGNDWKAEHDKIKTNYDKLKGEYDTYKTTVETEKATATKKTALRSSLKAEGANEKLIELLEGKFDLEKIEVDGEKIKGWDDLVKPVKEQFSEVFGTVQTQGANPATPPKSEATKPTGSKDMNAYIRGIAE